MAPSACQEQTSCIPLSLCPLTPSHQPLGCYRGLEHKPEYVMTLLETLEGIISELLTRPTSTLFAKLWPQRPTISTSTSGLSHTGLPPRLPQPHLSPQPPSGSRLLRFQVSTQTPSQHLAQPQILRSVCLLKRW